MARSLLFLLSLLPLLCCLQPAACFSNSVKVSTTTIRLDATGESTGPAYDLPKKSKVSINCTVTSTSDLTGAKVTWKRVNSNASVDGDRYQVTKTMVSSGKLESVLTVEDLKWDDVGNYSCSCCDDGPNVGSGVGGILSAPLMRLLVNGDEKFDMAVWPNESIAVTCEVGGGLQAKVKWLKDNDASFSEGNETLTLTGVRYPEDRATFTCQAANGIGNNTASLFLRVKNPQAFLLPLVILVSEICVIGVIVAAYEFHMRRKRQQTEKAD